MLESLIYRCNNKFIDVVRYSFVKFHELLGNLYACGAYYSIVILLFNNYYELEIHRPNIICYTNYKVYFSFYKKQTIVS